MDTHSANKARDYRVRALLKLCGCRQCTERSQGIRTGDFGGLDDLHNNRQAAKWLPRAILWGCAGFAWGFCLLGAAFLVFGVLTLIGQIR